MKAMRLVLAVLLLAVTSSSMAGRIFVTGHDPIWHSNFGGNTAGAANMATTGIDYVRNGSTDKFLFIESITTPIPGGNARTAPFLSSALGYTGQYDVIDGAGLNALADFAAFLSGYSAIVVASDHGGMLTAAELQFLNNNTSDIIDYINAGGGLYAEAESNAQGLIGAETPFGFLPFLVSSTSFQASETSNQVTAFGAGLGLTNADVNGNFSHNFFASTGGMNVVDTFNGDPTRPLTLAFDGTITTTGVSVPEPASLALLIMGMIFLGFNRYRRIPAG